MFSNSNYTQDLLSRDLATIWHPDTKDEDIPVIPLARAKGVWLEDTDGNKYLDATSSCGVNLLGHAHSGISLTIKRQMDMLEYVSPGGFTHEPVVELTEQILDLAPEGLTRCFYTEAPTSAIEAAIKMSLHYWKNTSKPSKRKFVTLSNSYYNETTRGLTQSNKIPVPSPDCYHRDPGEDEEGYVTRMFVQMEEVLANQHYEIAAVVIEPLVQAKSFMRMYHVQYLKLLRDACDRYDIHLITDETEIGCGRTGSMFACDQAEISPDIICLSKGLTNGYLSLSIAVTTEQIYQASYTDASEAKSLFYSSPYAGNPLACAAATATMNLLRVERIVENNQELSALTWRCVEHMLDHPHVGDVRQTGMVLAIEIVKDKDTKEPFPRQERRGLRAYQHALANHVLFQPLGDVLYLMPPYVIQPDLIKMAVEVMCESIDTAVRE